MSAAAMVRSTSKLVCHTTKESLRAVRKRIDPSTTIGFVPTMGALHEGEEPDRMSFMLYSEKKALSNPRIISL
jgi:hypothetical protein